MTDPTNIVGPKEFTDRTGLTRQTFYNCLKDMKAAGIVDDDVKRIDMDCQWMQNYMASAGRKQRRHTPSPAAQNGGSGGIAPTIDGLPTLETLNHYEQFEKVRKMQIDNETKLGNLTANHDH
jgi:hypothetical protein